MIFIYKMNNTKVKQYKEGEFYFLGEYGIRLIEKISENIWKVRIYSDDYSSEYYKTIHVSDIKSKRYFGY